METVTGMAFIGNSLSGGEILIVFLAVLMLFGSKKVPEIARTIGKSLEEFRRASRSVTDEIMRADIKDEKPPARLTPRPSTPADPESQTGASEEEIAEGEPEAPVPRPSAHAVKQDSDPA